MFVRQDLISLAMRKGAGYAARLTHMGIIHTGAVRNLSGFKMVTDSQRLNRKEKYYGGPCRHDAAID
jgi:hypothetical protein